MVGRKEESDNGGTDADMDQWPGSDQTWFDDTIYTIYAESATDINGDIVTTGQVHFTTTLLKLRLSSSAYKMLNFFMLNKSLEGLGIFMEYHRASNI